MKGGRYNARRKKKATETKSDPLKREESTGMKKISAERNFGENPPGEGGFFDNAPTERSPTAREDVGDALPRISKRQADPGDIQEKRKRRTFLCHEGVQKSSAVAGEQKKVSAERRLEKAIGRLRTWNIDMHALLKT